MFSAILEKLKLRGASDGTEIGNSGDRLKVESITTATQSDAFGRVRVSETKVIFNASFTNNSNTLLFTSNTATGGTVTRNTNTSSMNIATTTTSGSTAAYQTKEYFRYVPGQSFLVNASGKFGTAKANVTQRIGYFDNNDGVFFELAGTDLRVVRRSSTSGSPVNTTVSQASWNLDPLDGTGPSGATLDLTKQQIFIIDFQWLGSGRIRFGFSNNGNIVYVHEINSANVLDIPYSRTGTLPVRASVTNTGTSSGATTLRLTCVSVMVEGDNRSFITQHAIARSNGKSLNNSVFRPVISLRLKSAFNRGAIQLDKIPIISETADNLEVRIILNGSLTGASWTSAGANSIAEYDQSATAVSGGELVDTFYVTQNAVNISSLSKTLVKLVSDFNGTADTMTVAIKSIDTNATARAGFVFEETF